MELVRALLLALALVSLQADRVVDRPCVVDPAYPDNCPTQLGAIGGPVLESPDEGFQNVIAPLVDPLLLLTTATGLDGRLYALNPTADRVRVFQTTDTGSGENASGLTPLRDISVCRRPSALAQSEDGAEVFVACHGSAAIAVIDTTRDLVVAVIQDRDTEGRPHLQEPMGMVVADGELYVASSQNDRIAVIDLSRRVVTDYITIPGPDPRALRLAGEGRYLVAANFLAGNRTEAVIEPHPAVLDPETMIGEVCAPLLQRPDVAALIDPSHQRFMDTTHEDYAEVAECFLFAETFGVSDTIVRQPRRADHDLVVIDRASRQVVFSTNTLDVDLGATNYDVATDATGGRLFLVATQARNALGHRFGNRPLINQLTILDLDPATGALAVETQVDLDAAALSETGSGRAAAAIPAAIAVHGGSLLVTASGTDALVQLSPKGAPEGTIPVGFGPRGVVAHGTTAFVYNGVGLSISKVDLAKGTTIGSAPLGPSPLNQDERMGARLFHSAQYSSNGTFACASCHPDGHQDGLVWELNDRDGLRATMPVAGIADTAPYHWDGSKCNLHDIVQDSIADLFRNARTLSACELKTLSAYMSSLELPGSPFRALDDSLSEEAKLGSLIFHRGRFKDAANVPRTCSERLEDPATEGFYLRATGDPFARTFQFNGGGGPIPSTRSSESCSLSNCHVTPLAESRGFKNGDPEAGLIDGYQAVSTIGVWDRASSQHDGRTTREAFVRALETNRAFHGAPALTGVGRSGLPAMAFNDANFRHAEYNFDDRPETHGFVLTEAVTRFMMEEQRPESAAIGLTVVLTRTPGDPTERRLLEALLEGAHNGKLALLSVGTLRGALTQLTYDPADDRFVTVKGARLSLAELRQSLNANDVQVLRGALLPHGTPGPSKPKLRAVLRESSPILCSEDYAHYPATVEDSEAQATLLIQADGVIPGTRVLVDGFVTGETLAGSGNAFTWSLPQAPAAPDLLTVQLVGPDGRLSNTLPVPVIHPVVPALEPVDLVVGVRDDRPEFRWQDQFGVTGPGTRYDVFRGDLGSLRNALKASVTGETGSGLEGECVTPPDWAEPRMRAPVDPEPGTGVFFLVRARNQLGVTSWGSAPRDAAILRSPAPCE